MIMMFFNGRPKYRADTIVQNIRPVRPLQHSNKARCQMQTNDNGLQSVFEDKLIPENTHQDHVTCSNVRIQTNH